MVTTLEICAGAGGQALGLEQAGFHHVALVEIEKQYCETLKRNRPQWKVICQDVQEFKGRPYRNKVDLLAGGVPCPPFSVAGKQLGQQDERDLFPEAIRLTKEIRPKAIMLENVRGLQDPKFDDYRVYITESFETMGYHMIWKLIHSSDFGVPQLRPRMILVGIRKDLYHKDFLFPTGSGQAPSVGETLWDLLGEKGWKGVARWKEQADRIAPTIVGGSKKHGGPDLGPTRAKRAWAEMGIDGKGIANEAPKEDFVGMPRLTCRMVARIQGFPDDWIFTGSKTAQYRQIGNAFPPPVAKAIGEAIKEYIRWKH
ncbi:MAG TPA: DNA cytosine methyltransferase [Candidatus Fimimorpha excrementavium]|nr:DNA cytosine methyltransferase [Candidatus Fimimorpha excrementavium]